jgi:hypothetical protein
MNKKIFPLLISLFTIGFLFYACDDSISSADIENKIIPDSNVSYAEYIQPLFTIKCTSSGCHDDRTQSAGLSLTSYGFAVANYAMIAPGNPSNSKIVWAIEGNGARLMPPLGITKPMNANQIKGIKTWIREGAQNN